jgi:DNA-binding HxlR family transcriptional regulator
VRHGHTDVTAPASIRDSGDCQIADMIFTRVGDRWSMLLVMLLGDGPRRFSELKRGAYGISQRMLTLTLRSLERDGFVTRTIIPARPPRVDYALTPLGLSLCAPVRALGAWAQAHHGEIEAARRAFDAPGDLAPGELAQDGSAQQGSGRQGLAPAGLRTLP